MKKSIKAGTGLVYTNSNEYEKTLGVDPNLINAVQMLNKYVVELSNAINSVHSRVLEIEQSYMEDKLLGVNDVQSGREATSTDTPADTTAQT